MTFSNDGRPSDWAIATGLISRFGFLDATDGGRAIRQKRIETQQLLGMIDPTVLIARLPAGARPRGRRQRPGPRLRVRARIVAIAFICLG
jgi:hypothetical protein